MRVTYNRELKVKSVLDELHIENFLPMHYEKVTTVGSPQRELVPAVHNLIFVRNSMEILSNLKATVGGLAPLKFMTRPQAHGSDHNEVIFVPDHEMENFMRVASVIDDGVRFLEMSDYIDMVGRNVRITDGVFKGVEGVIKRIKKNKLVVVRIQGVAAVAITTVSPDLITEI